MRFDYWLFDKINGWAGHIGWCDTLGRLTAVYGLLLLMLIAITLIWWPWSKQESRLRLMKSLALAAVGCAILAALEWFLTTHFLHHELRARPANAHWTTLLITEESSFSFPAWPVLFASAISIALYAFSRYVGTIATIIGVSTGIALVFVGINYPFDVVTGAFLGSAIGYTAIELVGQNRWQQYRKKIALVWIGILFWALLIAATMRPVHPSVAASQSEMASVTVTPPPAVLRAIQPLHHDGKVALQAATNGHITVASLKIVLPDHQVPLTKVESIAKFAVNAAFQSWPTLGIETVEVAADYHQGERTRLGTLYTATVSRDQWEIFHRSSKNKLPGRKFFNNQFYSNTPSKSGT
ncbi:MAG TPA: hypothetical protein VHV83_04855 [Armatimonadota bacterium]|nr:hypothetical protein [Armatimonadota bacterium]